MKICTIIAILLSLYQQVLTAQSSHQQRFDPNWVRTFNGHGFSWAYDIALDAEGNIYATGYYQNALSIDTLPNKKSSLWLNAGSGDIYFLCKFDNKGRFCWIQRGFGNTRPCKVKMAPDGNVQVVGTCHGKELLLTSAKRDTISFYNKVNYRSKIFLAKYSPDGELIQARLLPTTQKQAANDFDFDPQGNIYIGGAYEFRHKNNPPLVQNSYLILKLDRNYKLRWQMQGDTTGKSHIFGIEYHPVHGLLVSGGYERWLRFKSDSICTPNNEGRRFFAKFDKDLNYQWMKGTIGRISQGNCISTKFDSRGNIIVLCNSSYGIMTLSKYSSNSELEWTLDTKGNLSAYPEKLLLDRSDNIYICGNSYGSTFSSTYGIEVQAERAGYAPFMVKYRPDGKLWWFKTIGGGGTFYCKSMDIKGDNIYGFGWTNSPLEFQTLTVPITTGYTFWIGEFNLAEFDRNELKSSDRK